MVQDKVAVGDLKDHSAPQELGPSPGIQGVYSRPRDEHSGVTHPLGGKSRDLHWSSTKF